MAVKNNEIVLAGKVALDKINYQLPNIFSIFIYPYRYKQAGCYFVLENQEEICVNQHYLLIASREKHK